MKTRIPPVLITFALSCFSLVQNTHGVSPPPDGGYRNQNTAEGTDALFLLQNGVWNVAVGFQALYHNNNGNQNTATGYRALFTNAGGDKNTAYGSQALYKNYIGNENVAIGFDTLYSNDGGNQNTAIGHRALVLNDSDDNTAIGWSALYNNEGSLENTAIGSGALFHGDASFNTAVGYQAIYNNHNGEYNTAVGHSALFNNVSGGFNTAIGYAAGFGNSSGSSNIYIGSYAGVDGESQTIRLGQFGTQTSTFIAGISGITISGGAAVYVNSSGQLGTLTSSARYKGEIKPMEKASEAILALKPVTFRYKKELDPDRVPQFGLVAEDVAKVNPALVLPDKEGKPYTVRYEAINAMLLNEFLKEHKKVEEQQATIAELKSTVAQQQKGFESKLTKQEKQIEAVTAGLQKVSAQLELNKLAPQTVKNND